MVAYFLNLFLVAEYLLTSPLSSYLRLGDSDPKSLNVWSWKGLAFGLNNSDFGLYSYSFETMIASTV